MSDSTEQAVDHPQHYGGDVPWEHVKILEERGWGYHTGNATKYMWRAGRKSGKVVEDLRKALWYVERRVLYISYRYEDRPLFCAAAWIARTTRGAFRPRPEITSSDIAVKLLLPTSVSMALDELWDCHLMGPWKEIRALQRAASFLHVAVNQHERVAEPIPVAAVGDPPAARQGPLSTGSYLTVWNQQALLLELLREELGFDRTVAISLVQYGWIGDTVEDAMPVLLKMHPGMAPDRARELVALYRRLIRWNHGVPYRIDVDPQETTRS